MTSERFASSGMALPEYLALLEARADGLATRLAEAERILTEAVTGWGIGMKYVSLAAFLNEARAFLATSEVAK